MANLATLFEELCIYIDKEELAQLLGADPGFSVQNVEEEKGGYRILLSRETTLAERNPKAERTEQPQAQAGGRSFP